MQRTSIIFHHPVGNADLKANQIHVQMKIAYLYVRVSTDEQKRKGYSLPEQEYRLLKYCRYNNIEVKGIYREDFSAKNFNRPEWKKLFLTVKNKPKEEQNRWVDIRAKLLWALSMSQWWAAKKLLH